jgi:hypothetical protein
MGRESNHFGLAGLQELDVRLDILSVCTLVMQAAHNAGDGQAVQGFGALHKPFERWMPTARDQPSPFGDVHHQRLCHTLWLEQG